jgi:ubiquinol-cytochrome c reductase cytochrome b subunit
MFGSLLILLILPKTDLSITRGSQFRPLMKLLNWLFFVNFFILMWIGSQHPETPFVEIGQFATFFYFAWFLIIVPAIGIVENSMLGVISGFSEENTSLDNAQLSGFLKFKQNLSFAKSNLYFSISNVNLLKVKRYLLALLLLDLLITSNTDCSNLQELQDAPTAEEVADMVKNTFNDDDVTDRVETIAEKEKILFELENKDTELSEEEEAEEARNSTDVNIRLGELKDIMNTSTELQNKKTTITSLEVSIEKVDNLQEGSETLPESTGVRVEIDLDPLMPDQDMTSRVSVNHKITTHLERTPEMEDQPENLEDLD